MVGHDPVVATTRRPSAPSSHAANDLAVEAATLATLCRAQRRDGAVFAYERAAIGTGATLAVNETGPLGLLRNTARDPPEPSARLCDHAALRIHEECR
jgi:hypothetical protein